MSYLDKINKEAEDDKDINVLFQNIYGIIKHDLQHEILHCFFEGEDSKYYISRINGHKNNEKVEVHDCKRKSNVIKMYKKITSSINCSNVQMLFFVDNDFGSNNHYNDDIYVTPCYAIENFYIQDSTISDFISSEMNIRRSSMKKIDREDYENALKYFLEERKKLIERIKLLNAWYSLQNSYYDENSESNPDLSGLDVIDVNKEIDLQYLKENTKHYVDLTDEDLQKEIDRLSKDPLNLFRGKYFTQFLVYIINILVSQKAKDMKILHKVRKVKSNISEANIISQLSNYAITPKCLREYLRNRLECGEREYVS